MTVDSSQGAPPVKEPLPGASSDAGTTVPGTAPVAPTTDKRPTTGNHRTIGAPGAPVRRSIADLPVIDQKETRRIPWLPMLALVAMTGLIVSKLWPGRVEVPRSVIGEWSTTDPRYAGRRLRIDSVEIVHDNGDDGEVHGRITEVESSSDGEGLEVRIDYLDGDRTASIAVRYRGGRDEHLLVGEQRGVRWVRSGVWVNDGTPESVRPQMPDSRSAPPDLDAPVPAGGLRSSPPGGSGPPR